MLKRALCRRQQQNDDDDEFEALRNGMHRFESELSELLESMERHADTMRLAEKLENLCVAGLMTADHEDDVCRNWMTPEMDSLIKEWNRLLNLSDTQLHEFGSQLAVLTAGVSWLVFA